MFLRTLPLLILPIIATAAPELLVADFEGDSFADWKASGEAFGQGPATGALEGQMPVSGYLGTGFVNGYHGGDDSTGTLESPPFKIERKHLNFLIGGGKFPGETCMDLVVDGKVAFTATGFHDRPGGSERLEWQGWDTSGLIG